MRAYDLRGEFHGEKYGGPAHLNRVAVSAAGPARYRGGMRWLWVVAVVSSGCVAPMALMRNEQGDLQRCDGATAQISGGLIGADLAVQECVRQYEAAGYRRVSEQRP